MRKNIPKKLEIFRKNDIKSEEIHREVGELYITVLERRLDDIGCTPEEKQALVEQLLCEQARCEETGGPPERF